MLSNESIDWTLKVLDGLALLWVFWCAKRLFNKIDIVKKQWKAMRK